MCLRMSLDLPSLNDDFNFIGVGDGMWIPLSAPFLENSEMYNGLIYNEV